jgi:hypothetical protein
VLRKRLPLSKAQKAQNDEDNDHKADNVDDPVHCIPIYIEVSAELTWVNARRDPTLDRSLVAPVTCANEVVRLCQASLA